MEKLVQVEPTLATRWARLWAAIIDMMVALVFVFLLQQLASLLGKEIVARNLSAGERFSLSIIGLAWFIIVNARLLKTSGQTIGKYFLKIQIVHVQSNQLLSLNSLIVKRYLPIWVLSAVPGLGSFFSTLDALFIFGKEKRCLHDLIADTKVIALEQSS